MGFPERRQDAVRAHPRPNLARSASGESGAVGTLMPRLTASAMTGCPSGSGHVSRKRQPIRPSSPKSTATTSPGAIAIGVTQVPVVTVWPAASVMPSARQLVDEPGERYRADRPGRWRRCLHRQAGHRPARRRDAPPGRAAASRRRWRADDEAVGAGIVGDQLRAAGGDEIGVARVRDLDRQMEVRHGRQHFRLFIRPRPRRQVAAHAEGELGLDDPHAVGPERHGSPVLVHGLREQAAGDRPVDADMRAARQRWSRRSSSRTAAPHSAPRSGPGPDSLPRAWPGAGPAAGRPARCRPANARASSSAAALAVAMFPLSAGLASSEAGERDLADHAAAFDRRMRAAQVGGGDRAVVARPRSAAPDPASTRTATSSRMSCCRPCRLCRTSAG